MVGVGVAGGRCKRRGRWDDLHAPPSLGALSLPPLVRRELVEECFEGYILDIWQKWACATLRERQNKMRFGAFFPLQSSSLSSCREIIWQKWGCDI